MMGFIMALSMALLYGGLVVLWFELFNTISFNLNDKWYYDFVKFVFVLYLPILFIFFFIFVVL